jgi:hypothetical protein
MKLFDANLLYEYAKNCKFIIETGSGGKSTKFLAKAARMNNSKFISIELLSKRCHPIQGVEYMNGWSVDFNDVIKVGDKDFVDMVKWKKFRNRDIDYVDGRIAHGDSEVMEGERNLIRKAINRYKECNLDFFFCDSGEYCGIAEWNIVKDKIKVGGYFVIHDIYYPKSIKGFKVLEKIKNNDRWEIVKKTKSKQGLLFARKNSD